MAENISRITELSSIIHNNTVAINKFLDDNRLPSPSFTVGAPAELSLPLHLLRAQQGTLEACIELQALIKGPENYFNRISSPSESISFAVYGSVR